MSAFSISVDKLVDHPELNSSPAQKALIRRFAQHAPAALDGLNNILSAHAAVASNGALDANARAAALAALQTDWTKTLASLDSLAELADALIAMILAKGGQPSGDDAEGRKAIADSNLVDALRDIVDLDQRIPPGQIIGNHITRDGPCAKIARAALLKYGVAP
jgi:hypothetical protein